MSKFLQTTTNYVYEKFWGKQMHRRFEVKSESSIEQCKRTYHSLTLHRPLQPQRFEHLSLSALHPHLLLHPFSQLQIVSSGIVLEIIAKLVYMGKYPDVVLVYPLFKGLSRHGLAFNNEFPSTNAAYGNKLNHK